MASFFFEAVDILILSLLKLNQIIKFTVVHLFKMDLLGISAEQFPDLPDCAPVSSDQFDQFADKFMFSCHASDVLCALFRDQKAEPVPRIGNLNLAQPVPDSSASVPKK